MWVNFFLILNLIISIALVIFFAYRAYIYSKRGIKEKFLISFSYLGVVFLFLSILFFMWVFGFLEYSSHDVLVIYSFVFFAINIIFFAVFYWLLKNKSLIYLFIFYIIGSLSSFFLVADFIFLSSVLSFLVFLIFNIQFYLEFRVHKRITFLGIALSCANILIYFLIFLGLIDSVLVVLISNSLFFIYSFYFFEDLWNHSSKSAHTNRFHLRHYIISFVKSFIFIILFSNLILISTLGIHELGHVVGAYFFDCTYKTILFEAGKYPYTEVLCSNSHYNSFILASGAVLPIIVSILLLLVDGTFSIGTFFLISGFDLIVSYKDLIDLNLSQNLVISNVILGCIFVLGGVYYLIKSQVNDSSIYHLI